jgi:mycothiol system anti-sigma-R factor
MMPSDELAIDHGFARDNLDAYLDNELPAEEHNRVREHLAHCPECRGQARAIMQIKSLVHRSCRESAPSSLRVRIQQQVTIWGTE